MYFNKESIYLSIYLSKKVPSLCIYYIYCGKCQHHSASLSLRKGFKMKMIFVLASALGQHLFIKFVHFIQL